MLPEDRVPVTTNTSRSRLAAMAETARRDNLTLRQLYERYAGTRGSYAVVGTPTQIADVMEEWVRSEAADGFIIQASYLPGGFDDFVTLVVPELQRRGLMRSRYAAATLREHLGLARPANRHARHADAAPA